MKQFTVYPNFIAATAGNPVPTQSGATTVGTSGTGWTVGKVAAGYGVEMKAGVKRPATDFTTFVNPNYDTSLGTNCTHITVPDVGQGSTLPIISITYGYEAVATSGGVQDGNFTFNIGYDGSGSWQPIASQLIVGPTITNLATTPVNWTTTVAAGAGLWSGRVAPPGSGIRIAHAWNITGAGSSNSHDVMLRNNPTYAKYVVTFADAAIPNWVLDTEHAEWGDVGARKAIIQPNNPLYPPTVYTPIALVGSPVKCIAQLTAGRNPLRGSARATPVVSATLTVVPGTNLVNRLGSLADGNPAPKIWPTKTEYAGVPTWGAAATAFSTSADVWLYAIEAGTDPTAFIPETVTLTFQCYAGIIPAGTSVAVGVYCYSQSPTVGQETAWIASLNDIAITSEVTTLTVPVITSQVIAEDAVFSSFRLSVSGATSPYLPIYTKIQPNLTAVTTQPIAAFAQAEASATGQIRVGNSFGSALAAAEATASGMLTLPTRIQAVAQAVASAPSVLTAYFHIAAAALAESASTGTLTAKIKLLATPQMEPNFPRVVLFAQQQCRALAGSVASMAAALMTKIKLAAAPSVQASVTPALTAKIKLNACPAGVATGHPTLSTHIPLQAFAACTASSPRCLLLARTARATSRMTPTQRAAVTVETPRISAK